MINGMAIDKAQKIHCLGIGGIGISAIAKLLIENGKEISGSDAVDSEILREAEAAGVQVVVGHNAKNLPKEAELLIYSEAVPENNPEREEARRRGIPEISGARALAKLTRGKRLVAVSGTNGKSTTTALIGLLLEAGGFDPTVFVGSKVQSFPLGNVRKGRGEWFVLEADEYRAKFLNFTPEIAVLTNIEEDHLDYFQDLGHIRDTYQVFLERVRPDGRIFINADDDVCMNDLEHGREMVTYGLNGPADYLARDIEVREGWQWFKILRTAHHEEMIGEFSLAVPGKFNVMNALAALSVALELGVSVDVCQKVLEEFSGIWRRFERVGEKDGALVISDYAHHPTAIRETLQAAREFYPDRRVVLVFQPHHHHRTKALFRNFVSSFSKADVLILSKIYKVQGREEATRGVSSQDLAQAVKDAGKVNEVYYAGDLEETEKLVREQMKPGDLILITGAGSIDILARKLLY